MAEFERFGFQHREKNVRPAILKEQYPSKDFYVLSNIEGYAREQKYDKYFPPEFVKRIHINDFKHLSEENVKNGIFYVYFSNDDVGLPYLRKILDLKGIFIPPCWFAKRLFFQILTPMEKICDELKIVKNESERDWDYCIAYGICNAIEATKNLPEKAIHLEVGVYKGRSAEITLSAMKHFNLQRKCYFMDNFIGFSYDVARKSSDFIWQDTHLEMGENHYEFLTDKFNKIVDNRTNDKYEIIKSDIITDNLPDFLNKAPIIATLNIDVDMYEAIICALVRLSPFVMVEGVILIEDATSTPGLYGAYIAMHDFLESTEGKKYIKVHQRAQYMLIKVRN